MEDGIEYREERYGESDPKVVSAERLLAALGGPLALEEEALQSQTSEDNNRPSPTGRIIRDPLPIWPLPPMDTDTDRRKRLQALAVELGKQADVSQQPQTFCNAAAALVEAQRKAKLCLSSEWVVYREELGQPTDHMTVHIVVPKDSKLPPTNGKWQPICTASPPTPLKALDDIEQRITTIANIGGPQALTAHANNLRTELGMIDLLLEPPPTPATVKNA